MLAINVLLEQKTTSTLKPKNPANAYDSKSVKFTTFFFNTKHFTIYYARNAV